VYPSDFKAVATDLSSASRPPTFALTTRHSGIKVRAFGTSYDGPVCSHSHRTEEQLKFLLVLVCLGRKSVHGPRLSMEEIGHDDLGSG
jgi:hypothetical protein